MNGRSTASCRSFHRHHGLHQVIFFFFFPDRLAHHVWRATHADPTLTTPPQGTHDYTDESRAVIETLIEALGPIATDDVEALDSAAKTAAAAPAAADAAVGTGPAGSDVDGATADVVTGSEAPDGPSEAQHSSSSSRRRQSRKQRQRDRKDRGQQRGKQGAADPTYESLARCAAACVVRAGVVVGGPGLSMAISWAWLGYASADTAAVTRRTHLFALAAGLRTGLGGSSSSSASSASKEARARSATAAADRKAGLGRLAGSIMLNLRTFLAEARDAEDVRL